jgi:hypothetical protein
LPSCCCAAGATDGRTLVLGKGIDCVVGPESFMPGGGNAGGGAEDACASTVCACATGNANNTAQHASHSATFTTRLLDVCRLQAYTRRVIRP